MRRSRMVNASRNARVICSGVPATMRDPELPNVPSLADLAKQGKSPWQHCRKQ